MTPAISFLHVSQQTVTGRGHELHRFHPNIIYMYIVIYFFQILYFTILNEQICIIMCMCEPETKSLNFGPSKTKQTNKTTI